MADFANKTDLDIHRGIIEAQDYERAAREELRRRERERRDLDEMQRQLQQIGEYLDTDAYINCGNCSRCGYGPEHDRMPLRDATTRPHGPYAYLYIRSAKAKSGYTCRYVRQDDVGEVSRRIREKREEARAEVARLEGERRAITQGEE